MVTSGFPKMSSFYHIAFFTYQFFKNSQEGPCELAFLSIDHQAIVPQPPEEKVEVAWVRLDVRVDHRYVLFTC